MSPPIQKVFRFSQLSNSSGTDRESDNEKSRVSGLEPSGSPQRSPRAGPRAISFLSDDLIYFPEMTDFKGIGKWPEWKSDNNDKMPDGTENKGNEEWKKYIEWNDGSNRGAGPSSAPAGGRQAETYPPQIVRIRIENHEPWAEVEGVTSSMYSKKFIEIIQALSMHLISPMNIETLTNSNVSYGTIRNWQRIWQYSQQPDLFVIRNRLIKKIIDMMRKCNYADPTVDVIMDWQEVRNYNQDCKKDYEFTEKDARLLKSVLSIQFK